MPIDVKSIAENVIKNNMGVGGIEVQVRGSVQGQSAKLAETGQTLPVKNAPASTSKPWQVFQAEGWGEGETVALLWIEERDQPRPTASAPAAR
jgi:hypothetical protein